MSDSSLKKILGAAAVGAAGVGAVYLLNKKTIDSAFGQIGEALGGVGQALGDFGSGISQGFNDFSKSLGDFGSGISQGFNDFSKSLGDFGSGISQGYEDISKRIGDYISGVNKTINDLTKSNLQQQQILTEQAQAVKNVVDYAGPGGAVALLSDALANGLQGLIDWINGGGAGQTQTTVNITVPGEFDPVHSLQFTPLAATDATPITTTTTTTAATNAALEKKYGVTEYGYVNIGQGRKVTGIKSNNKYVGNILKKYGFTIDDDSYV